MYDNLVDQLSFYYQNVRGLRTKIVQLKQGILNSDYHVIALTERWLLPRVNSGEMFDRRYSVYRCDRDALIMGKRKGGGVLLAINNTLRSEEITRFNIADELVIVKVRDCKGIAILFVVVYFTCGSSSDVYFKFY